MESIGESKTISFRQNSDPALIPFGQPTSGIVFQGEQVERGAPYHIEALGTPNCVRLHLSLRDQGAIQQGHLDTLVALEVDETVVAALDLRNTLSAATKMQAWPLAVCCYSVVVVITVLLCLFVTEMPWLPTKLAISYEGDARFSGRPGLSRPQDEGHASDSTQLQRDQSLADELNKRFEKGLIVKIIASPPGGADGSAFHKKFAQLLGLRRGNQPVEEGYLDVGWKLEEWPRDKDDPSGRGIAGNWFTSCSLINSLLASPYRPGAHGDDDDRESGTSLYGCNRYGCGRSRESHKMLAVFKPNPMVGCGFIEDAGTNQAGEFTGCASDWKGADGDWTMSKCLDSPDCEFKLDGLKFGGSGVGSWRVDKRFLPPKLNFSGRFDPDSEGTHAFVVDQIRNNPKASPKQVAAQARHHTLGYNELMVQVATPVMVFEEMQKREQRLFNPAKKINQLRLWQCRTNGVEAFARLQHPPTTFDADTIQVENNRFEVFRAMRDGYDRACGRSTPTPILFFDIVAEHNPFSAHQMDTLFPCQGLATEKGS